MQKIFEIEQGVPEICPWGQVSLGGKCRRGQVSGGQMSRSPLVYISTFLIFYESGIPMRIWEELWCSEAQILPSMKAR